MRSFILLKNRKVGLLAAAGALLFATVMPAIVSAAQLTSRSIALSSSSADANDVSYEVSFKSALAGAAEAFVVDFCEESPIIGQACSTPDGFSASGATSATVDFTDVTAVDANTVRVVGTITADTQITVALDHINNPTAAGPLYARIVTYDTEENALDHNPTQTAAQDTDRVDEGGAAIYINSTIGVSAAVLESMTFCVSKVDIPADCASTEAPVLALGETVGTTKALSPGVLSTGSIFTQISTNAASGAVVSLKSNATGCGGLLRAGAPGACNISPAQATGILAGQPKFGVRTAAATDAAGAVTTPSGTLVPVGNYNNTTYALNYTIGDEEGVTSAFGDPFLNTNSLPVSNKNVQLTFGASASNDTPAGLYSADLSLIATGKF